MMLSADNKVGKLLNWCFQLLLSSTVCYLHCHYNRGCDKAAGSTSCSLSYHGVGVHERGACRYIYTL